MITTNQCKAARALLNWTLDDLSKASGLSRTSLSNFEQGSNIKAESYKTIINAMESAGIEFTPEPGVRLKGQKLEVHRWQGNNIYERMLDDIYETCLKTGSEILFASLDETVFEGISFDASDLMRKQIKRLRQHNIKERVIYKEGDTYFTFPPDITAYRWIPADLFAMVPSITYGNKHAIVVPDAPPTLIVTESAKVSEMYKKQFEVLWSYAKPVPFSDEEIARICQENLFLD